MEKWQRQDNESCKHYELFCQYLAMRPRSVEKLSKTLQKSASYLRQIAARYEWRERAAAYDEACLETARQELRREFTADVLTQWRQCSELQAKATAELLRRDLSKVSPRILNEIITAAGAAKLKLAEYLKITEITGTEKSDAPVIQIVPMTTRLERE